MDPRRGLRNLGIRAAAAVLGLSLGAGTVLPVRAVETPVPAAASAAWLVGLLGPDAMIVDPALSIEDVDATLDLLLGLVAAGASGAVRETVAARLAADVTTHTGGDLGATFVGSTAKLALVLPAAGLDARDVGGTDLIALLTARIGADGRARDRGSLGDLSTPASQALVVLALRRAGTDPVVLLRAADALAAAACADGSLPVEFAATPCVGEARTTALAAAAFAAIAVAVGADAALAAARDDALAILLGLDGDGRLDPWAAGLTAAALRAADRGAEADAIATGLAARVDGCDGDGTAALIDVDPLRATVGMLLAVRGTTLTDLGIDGSTPATVPLDCTPATTQPPDGGAGAASGGAASGSDAGEDSAATGDRAPSTAGSGRRAALAAGIVLAVVLAAGIPVLRSTRRRADEPAA